jgi:hypothetical protein
MSSLPLRREANAESDFFKHLEKRAGREALRKKKEQGEKPCAKKRAGREALL